MTFARFKNILTVAAFSSLLAGLLLTAFQQFQVIPIIQEAEVYEQASETVESGSVHSHDDQHAHSGDAWQPDDGFERGLFTAFANIVIALGFALVLGAAITLRGGPIDWKSGLLWGLGGYAVFFVAPTIGLPPEVPGTEAADLLYRQLWWITAAICTAAGLALMVFNTRYIMKALGVVLVLVPHFVGAPQPELHSSTAPAELIQAFLAATVMANMVFWLSLGGLYGFFHQKLAN